MDGIPGETGLLGEPVNYILSKYIQVSKKSETVGKLNSWHLCVFFFQGDRGNNGSTGATGRIGEFGLLGDPGERGERGLSGEPVSHDVLREYSLQREHMESAIFGIVV